MKNSGATDNESELGGLTLWLARNATGYYEDRDGARSYCLYFPWFGERWIERFNGRRWVPIKR